MVGAAIGSIAQIPGIGGGFQVALRLLHDDVFHGFPGASHRHILARMGLEQHPDCCRYGVYMISHGLSLKDLRAAHS